MEENFFLVVIIICLLLALPPAGFYVGMLWRRREDEKEKEKALTIKQEAINRQEELISELQETLRKARLEKDEISHYFFRLPDFVRRLSSSPTLEQISSSVVRFLKSSLDPGEIGFFVFSPDENLLILVESFGLPPQYKNQVKIPLGQGKIGQAVAKGVIMSRDDYRQESALHRVKDESPYLRTDLCAPVTLEGAPLGAINLAKGQGDFKENDRRILAMVADLVAIPLVHYRIVQAKEWESHTDGLTGLYNKRYFSEKLVMELNKSAGYLTPLSLIIFDVDHFKHYNDTNGHPAGDEVLRRVSHITKSITRKTDFVARYGGEEFAVVMVGSTKLEALNHAEHIRETIEQTEFPDGEKQPMGRITISGGVATYPEDGESAGELIRRADEALYRAKGGGRNVICMYKPFEFGE